MRRLTLMGVVISTTMMSALCTEGFSARVKSITHAVDLQLQDL